MRVGLFCGAALAVVLAASGASAASDGWYGAVDIGGHYLQGIPVNTPQTDYTVNTRQFDWDGFARLGYRVSPHVRLEVEGGYRHDRLNSIRQSGLVTANTIDICENPNDVPDCGITNGRINSWTAMGNILFDLMPDAVLDPFIGGGLGVNHISVRADGFQVDGVNPASAVDIDTSRTKFAYQGIAGVSFRATDQVNVDLTYRYLSGASYGELGQGGLYSAGRYKDHSLSLGVRYAFAVAP